MRMTLQPSGDRLLSAQSLVSDYWVDRRSVQIVESEPGGRRRHCFQRLRTTLRLPRFRGRLRCKGELVDGTKEAVEPYEGVQGRGERSLKARRNDRGQPRAIVKPNTLLGLAGSTYTRNEAESERPAAAADAAAGIAGTRHQKHVWPAGDVTPFLAWAVTAVASD
jgi:hypothetical protein